MLTTSEAAAQTDLSSMFYADVKSVIEQLIEEEVATNSANFIRRQSPVAGAYLRSSIGVIESARWGTLGDALKRDLPALLGDFVYWDLQYCGATRPAEQAKCFDRFLRCGEAAAPAAGAPGPVAYSPICPEFTGVLIQDAQTAQERKEAPKSGVVLDDETQAIKGGKKRDFKGNEENNEAQPPRLALSKSLLDKDCRLTAPGNPRQQLHCRLGLEAKMLASGRARNARQIAADLLPDTIDFVGQSLSAVPGAPAGAGQVMSTAAPFLKAKLPTWLADPAAFKRDHAAVLKLMRGAALPSTLSPAICTAAGLAPTAKALAGDANALLCSLASGGKNWATDIAVVLTPAAKPKSAWLTAAAPGLRSLDTLLASPIGAALVSLDAAAPTADEALVRLLLALDNPGLDPREFSGKIEVKIGAVTESLSVDKGKAVGSITPALARLTGVLSKARELVDVLEAITLAYGNGVTPDVALGRFLAVRELFSEIEKRFASAAAARTDEATAAAFADALSLALTAPLVSGPAGPQSVCNTKLAPADNILLDRVCAIAGVRASGATLPLEQIVRALAKSDYREASVLALAEVLGSSFSNNQELLDREWWALRARVKVKWEGLTEEQLKPVDLASSGRFALLVQALGQAKVKGDTQKALNEWLSGLPAHPYRRFLVTFATYALETTGGQNDASVARDSFRAASKDLLRSISGEGYPKKRVNWLPNLALRASFSGSYSNEPNRSAHRYMASADWPVFRGSLGSSYVGWQASVFDLLAPFSEAAARKAVFTSESQPYLLLDLVRPRLGVWVGAPEFSRHLLITGLVGARFITSKPATAEKLEYTNVFDGAVSPSVMDGVLNTLELSGSVSYVF